MKKKIYIRTIVALMAVMIFTSCSDLFNVPDIQKNPNAPADAPIDVLMSGAMVGLSAVHEDTDARLSMMWGGQLAGLSRQHAGFQDYIVAASTFDNSWSILYSAAANARIIQLKAAPLNNKVALGISQVMEALLMAKVTSLYGDVPYSQAFDADKYPTPQFDKQLDVYNALIALLNSAYANLSAPTGSVTLDFIFKGSASKWAAAAKTLQARLYLHLKDYPNAVAAATLGISSTAGDALVPHGSSQQIDLNLNFDFFDISRPGDTGFDPPAYLPVFMKANGYKRNSITNDKALYNHFFQVGVYTTGALDPNTQDGVFTGDAPHPLLTYYENQLILAEANARLAAPNIGNAVKALNNVRKQLETGYINGKTIDPAYVALGIQYDPYKAADFNTGDLADKGQGTQQKNLIYEIISQRFIVLLAQYEIFNDLRRLQVATPVVKLPIPINKGTVYPARFVYPQNEVNTNPNVKALVVDQFTTVPIVQ